VCQNTLTLTCFCCGTYTTYYWRKHNEPWM